MASTASIQPAWTLQSQDTAAVGRLHDGASLQSTSSTPATQYRAGVIPTVATSGNTTAVDFFVLQASTPNMTVVVSQGNAVVCNNSGRGPYVCENTVQQTLTVATADPTNPRIDLVYVQVIDTVAGDTGSSTTQVGIVTGTPASSPSVPALPTNGVSIPLAQVRVNANVTSITNSNITDVRKSSGVGRGPRLLLPGDALSDPGFCYGELRQRIVSSYTSGGNNIIVTDYWNYDSTWRGMKPLQLNSGNITQNVSNWSTAEAVAWTLTIPDPGWPYWVDIDVTAFRNLNPGASFGQFHVRQTNLAGAELHPTVVAETNLAGTSVQLRGQIWTSTGAAFSGSTTIVVTEDCDGTAGNPSMAPQALLAMINPA